MEFRLLGPLEVSDGAGPIDSGDKPACAPGAAAPGRQPDGVARSARRRPLGRRPPETRRRWCRSTSRGCARCSEARRLRTRRPATALELAGDAIDLVRSSVSRAEGRAGARRRTPARGRDARERPSRCGAARRSASSEPFALVESAQLEELHLTCLEARIDADLALGRHAELVGELEALVAAPAPERLRGQLVLALYRSGRHADALARVPARTAQLVDELGIEPSTGMRELERRILRQDPALDLGRSGERRRGRRRRSVRYVSSGDVSIAYQTLGEGPIDLVVVPGWVSNLDLFWEQPAVEAFYRRLASFSRLILFDKRGTGLSDRVELPSLEVRMDDVRAVLDAVGSERAALLGYSEGGPMSRCSPPRIPTAPRRW